MTPERSSASIEVSDTGGHKPPPRRKAVSDTQASRGGESIRGGGGRLRQRAEQTPERDALAIRAEFQLAYLVVHLPRRAGSVGRVGSQDELPAVGESGAHCDMAIGIDRYRVRREVLDV